MKTAAVIGVGVMGSAIAGRLMDGGMRVALYDRKPEAGAALAERGAIVAASPAGAAEQADYVITSLNSAAIVEQAVFGDGGIRDVAGPDRLLVDMSSIDPTATASMADRLHRETGMKWVDAPLSGGASAAREGALTLMIGGAPEDVARAGPLFDRLASNHTHMGACGAGQTVKLINQILCAGAFLTVAEAVHFAEQHGVDAARIPAALAGGRADSRIMQEFMGKMARRDYSPTGRIDNMLKDLETVQAAALARHIAMPLTSLIADLHRMLVAGGLGSADSAAYMRLFDLAREGE
ncbi:MAG: NAD(P)-dependent oxidoreductase [Sphingobium sp.]